MSKPRVWHGTDGSSTVLLLVNDRVRIWTNLGMWIELHCDEDLYPEEVCELYALRNELEELSEDRARYYAGEGYEEEYLMTDEEMAGYGDSQELN